MMRAKHSWILGGLCLFSIACAGGGVAKIPPGAALDPPPPPQPETHQASVPAPKPKPRAPLADVQRKTIGAIEEALNAHDGKKLAELYAPDAMTGGPTPDGWREVKAREAMEKSHSELFAGFPDFKLATARVIQKGDVVSHEWQATGTHKGDFRGTKASGKTMSLRGLSVYVIGDDGLIKNEHNYFDHNTVRIQIGAAQGKARALGPAGAAEWIVAKGDDDKNAALAQKYLDSIANEKDMLALLRDDVVQISYSEPDDKKGKDAAKADMQMWLKAFPDAKASATRIVTVGDYVVIEAAYSGTHKGPLGPLKATNKPVTAHGVDVLLVKDGKVAKSWSYMSMLELMGQLGVSTEKKADDKKPADKPADKPAEKKADDKKPADKPAEKKADDKKAPEPPKK